MASNIKSIFRLISPCYFLSFADQKLGEYSFLDFTEQECLVALKGLPSYEIQLWSWRLGKKMMFKRTG